MANYGSKLNVCDLNAFVLFAFLLLFSGADVLEAKQNISVTENYCFLKTISQFLNTFQSDVSEKILEVYIKLPSDTD